MKLTENQKRKCQKPPVRDWWHDVKTNVTVKWFWTPEFHESGGVCNNELHFEPLITDEWNSLFEKMAAEKKNFRN